MLNKKTSGISVYEFCKRTKFGYGLVGISDIGIFCTSLPDWYWVCFGIVGLFYLMSTYPSIPKEYKFDVFASDMIFISLAFCLCRFIPNFLGLYKTLPLIVLFGIFSVKNYRFKIASKIFTPNKGEH